MLREFTLGELDELIIGGKKLTIVEVSEDEVVFKLDDDDDPQALYPAPTSGVGYAT